MKHAHFLCNINDDNWGGAVGALVLVSMGPVSQAYLQTAYRELRATDHHALDLNEGKMPDFSVRLVFRHGAKARLENFCEAVRESDNPLLVPRDLLPSVLRRAEADEELHISRLPVYQQGSLELVVYHNNVLKGRGFLVDGQIDLPQLANDFPAAFAEGRKGRPLSFQGRHYLLKPSAVLSEMPGDEQSIDAANWVLRNTYKRGPANRAAVGKRRRSAKNKVA